MARKATGEIKLSKGELEDVQRAGRQVQQKLKAVEKAEKAVRIVGAGEDGRLLRNLFIARDRLKNAEDYACSLFPAGMLKS